jgi:nucleotide-binding universal stress UspA family protein
VINLKRVLVATDFSDASNAALVYGRELARTFGARLDVLHVVPSLAKYYAAEAYTAAFPEIEEGMEQAAQREIDMLLTRGDRRLGARAILRTSQSPAAGITQHARDENIDLIVIGTQGRGGVAHLFVGSVAERVVRTAPCPVLTVRHPEHDFVSLDAPAADTERPVSLPNKAGTVSSRSDARTAPIVRRVAARFRKMPGMRLTAAQVKRLFKLSLDDCQVVLEQLVESRLLRRDDAGRYSLLVA